MYGKKRERTSKIKIQKSKYHSNKSLETEEHIVIARARGQEIMVLSSSDTNGVCGTVSHGVLGITTQEMDGRETRKFKSKK